MIIFPMIEKIAEWVKNQGSWIYWVWVVCVGLAGALFITVWNEYGFSSAIIPGIIFIGIWIGLAPVVAKYESNIKGK